MRIVAFGFTLVMTAVLTVLRLGLVPGFQSIQFGSINAEYFLIILVAFSIAVLFALCFSRKQPLRMPQGAWASVGGWICTFAGAVLALSVLLDTFWLLIYKQIPPPNTQILNGTDRVALNCTLLFGLIGGIFLAWQGFCWMSRDTSQHTVRSWLSLTPVLWMWFRLARYEVSYASTIDIGENFFDFATLICSLLFFLQFARFLTKVGRPPRSGLLICALCTAMISLSDAPVTISGIQAGKPLGFLLIAIVDTIIGIFALYVAMLQVFAKPVADDADESSDEAADTADDGLAWTDPPAEQPPLDPPFAINRVMPQTDVLTPSDSASSPATSSDKKDETDADTAPDAGQPQDIAVPADEYTAPQPITPIPETTAPKAPKKALTVDDLLDEIDNI